MERLELFGNVVELPAPDVGAQAGRKKVQIMQRDGDCNPVGRRGNSDFVVGGRHPDREANDLPRRNQPLHDQRKRKWQQLRGLQRGHVERLGDR